MALLYREMRCYTVVGLMVLLSLVRDTSSFCSSLWAFFIVYSYC